MKSFYAYSFLVGMFIGGYTNFFSKVVISGLVLYISHPESFDIDRFDPLFSKVKEITYPYITKVYNPTMLLISSIDPLPSSDTPQITSNNIKLKIPPIPNPSPNKK